MSITSMPRIHSSETAVELEFRPTRESDIDGLFWVRARTRENPVSTETLAALGITPTALAAALNSGAMKGWVSVHEGRVVGFCNGDTTTGEVLVLAVLPEYEGQGVGSRLLADVVEELRSQNPARRLWLAASADPRVRAYGFYRARGWLPTGEMDPFGDEILVLDSPQA